MSHFIELFFEHAGWLLAFPVAIAGIRFQRFDRARKVVCVYLFVSFITHIVCYVYWTLSKNNLPFLHVFTLLEFNLLLYYFYLLNKIYVHKQWFMVLGMLFNLFFFLDVLILTGWTKFNTYTVTFSSIVITILCLAWFIHVVSDYSLQLTKIKSSLYINSGFLIYFSASTILYSVNTYLNNLDINFRLNIWSIHTILNLIMYLFMTVGLWKYPKH